MTIKKGNLYTKENKEHYDLIGFTANSVIRKDGNLVMGAGSAKTVKDAYENSPKVFGERIKDKSVFHIEIVKELKLLALQTKIDWKDDSDINLVKESLNKLFTYATENPNLKIAIPFPGISNGNLKKETITPLLKNIPNNIDVWELPRQLIGLDFKFGMHIPANDEREDCHLVKEIRVYDDGTKEPAIRMVKNFKRPFYITKNHYQNHEQKKEFEDINKVHTYYSTQSQLANSIARKLNMTGYRRNSMRDVRDSPFLYGIDVSGTTILHKMYKTKYPNCINPYTVCVLDIETDIATNQITVMSIAMEGKIFTRMTKKYIGDRSNVEERIKKLFKENIPLPENELDVLINGMDIAIEDDELIMVRSIFNKLHEWKPDIVSVWNVLFDIGKIVNVCKRFDIDPRDIFSDPDIPKEYRVFKVKEGPKKSVKESGKEVPINVQDQWHTIISTSSFYFIDNMCAYSYVRAGSNAVPGGYGLNNILKHKLNLGKLKFESVNILEGSIEWHNHMSKNRPLEYVVYNQWDVLGVLALEKKTKDLSVNMPVLLGYSNFDIFSSGPKKIIDAFYFYGLENKKVIGSKPNQVDADKILGLESWIKKVI